MIRLGSRKRSSIMIMADSPRSWTGSRDPRTDPQAGDRLRLRGDLWEVLPLDGLFALGRDAILARTGAVRNLVSRRWWEENMQNADVLVEGDRLVREIVPCPGSIGGHRDVSR